MILIERYRSVLFCVASVAAGIALGWYVPSLIAPYVGPGTTSTLPALVVAETTESTTILPPKAKHRIQLADGTVVESDQPITVDITRTGPTLANNSSAVSTSAGLTTPNGEAAGNFNASAGSPSLPSLFGTPLNFTLPGGSTLSFTITPQAGKVGLMGLGVAFLIGAVALWYFTRNIILAACVGGIGVAIISIGLAPQLWIWSGLAIGAFGLGWLGIHIWRARGAKKSAEELTEYDELASEMRGVMTTEQIDGLKKSLPLNLRPLFDGLAT